MLSGLSRRVPGLEGGGRDAVRFYRSNAALDSASPSAQA
jgi:hypothetical protein